MKYSIEGFSQEKLVEQGLDCRDAVFLRWFVDFQATNQMKIHVEDSSVFYWIDHRTIITELPILGRSTPDSVGKYIKQLIDKGVLEKHLVRRGQDRGTEVYYRIVPALIYECTTDGEEHPHDRASTAPAQIGGSDSSTMIPQQEEEREEMEDQRIPTVSEKPELSSSRPGSQKKESVYQTLAAAARVYGKMLFLSPDDRQRIQTAVGVWTATTVCKAWTDWLEAGKKLSTRFFCEDTDFSKYHKTKAPLGSGKMCPNCGKRVKAWETTEEGCMYCIVVADLAHVEQSFGEIRKRLGQPKAV